MKVKDLISALQKFDPESEIGSRGHFGERLEVDLPYYAKEMDLVVIETEDKGEEPD